MSILINESAQKAFLFMYPQQDIIDFQIESESQSYFAFKYLPANIKESFSLANLTQKDIQKRFRYRSYMNYAHISHMQARKLFFKNWYSAVLNACIDARYRSQGFSVYFALLDDTIISDAIKVRSEDKIIYVGMNAKTHRTKKSDGTYSYPDENHIIYQLGNPDVLRIGGFHSNDCVSRVAKCAYGRNLNVLVDEELTELLVGYISLEPNFKISEYTPIRIVERNELNFYSIEQRSEKPWLRPWVIDPSKIESDKNTATCF